MLQTPSCSRVALTINFRISAMSKSEQKKLISYGRPTGEAKPPLFAQYRHIAHRSLQVTCSRLSLCCQPLQRELPTPDFSPARIRRAALAESRSSPGQPP
jgi:hypothetical protein